MVLRDSPGVRWELTNIIRHGAVAKTLFLFDPSAKDPHIWQALAAVIEPLFKAASLVPPEFKFHDRPIGFYFEARELVEIVNCWWTATSYRTAYSHFLTARQSDTHTPVAELA